MYAKFESLMKKYLVPLANIMDKEVHLSAVKKAMVALTPLLIIGSFCLIPEAIPNMIGQENPISVWINSNLDIIYLPYNVGMALMSIYVAVIIAYHLANSYKLDVPGCTTMSLIAFLMLVVEYTEGGGIAKGYMGPKGLFCAMFAGFISVELYRWCKNKNFTIKMPESVPDFVSRSFEMIPISVVVVGFFLAVRIFCVNVLNTMPALIFTNLFAPLVGSMDNPIAYTFLKMLQSLLFFFGIHPSVLSPITSPIMTQFLAENIAAVQAGGIATHFYSSGTESAFGGFTGSGVTIGCVFWCLMSKNKALKQIGRIALIPALFGINEPILFGAPIVLNPIFFIPFVILGGIVASLGGWAMYLGLMDCGIYAPPYVGVFLEGYLCNFDPRGILVNLVQLIASIAVWYPFFKMYEKNYATNEEVASVNEEDVAILNDLELDF